MDDARRACPVCAGGPLARFAGAAGHLRCRACGVAFPRRMPDPAAVARLYGEEYRPARGRIAGLAARAFALARRRRARRLVRLVRARRGAPIRCLDVGCGEGEFLEEMSALGARCVGTELTRMSAANATARGIDVRVGDLAALAFEAGRFDLVTVFHVLEHTPRPLDELAEARRILAPGGVLALAVPNVASVQAAVAGPRWVHLDPPRHLWHFAPAGLRSMLASTGFDVEAVGHVSIEQGAFGWLCAILGPAGLDRLPWRLVRGDLGAPATWCCAAALAPAAAAAGALALVEALLGRGAAVEVVARATGGRAIPVHPSPASPTRR